MIDILLTTESFVKQVTNISDNVNGKVMQSAIRESQDMDLKQVLGSNMINKLKTLVSGGTIDNPENIAYKNLLDECQYFLAYSTMSKLIPLVTFKIDNIGLSSTQDENITTYNVSDTFNIKGYFDKKVDWYRMELQNYVIENKADLPEIGNNTFTKIQSNLYSAASGGLWLGGARGKSGYNPKNYIGK